MEAAVHTIREMSEGLRAKHFSSEELVKHCFQRMDATEPAIHAMLSRDHDGALATARKHDASRSANRPDDVLAGIPFVIKDTIVVKGMPATAGSKFLEHYRPPYDATVIERLREQGAIILGKANCDEFAMGASGENSAFGATKNPWDVSRVPGGSSSGSAAAVAVGDAPAALGSDTGGSIRQPAGFCGVVGLKPTYGRVSRYGLIALASSLDHIGPITHTVEDAAIVLNAIAGTDSHDATSVAQPPVDCAAVRAGEIRGLHIGVPKEYFSHGIDPRVEKIVRNALTLLEQQGAMITDVSLPHTEYALRRITSSFQQRRVQTLRDMTAFGTALGLRQQRRLPRCMVCRATRDSGTNRNVGLCSAPTSFPPAITMPTI